MFVAISVVDGVVRVGCNKVDSDFGKKIGKAVEFKVHGNFVSINMTNEVDVKIYDSVDREFGRSVGAGIFHEAILLG